MDGFAHFDPGYRILNGEYPLRDYWVVHGVFIDYLQALFFFLFGVSWKSYVLHASLLNGLLTAATYFIFRNFNLNKSYSLIYSFFFSVLAYTSSGTPFLDHHSAFFSLFGIYCLILGIDKEKKLIVNIKRSDLAKEVADARPEVFSQGNALDAKIIDLDLETRKIKLSVKAAQIDEEKSLIAKFGKGATKSGATLKGIFEKAIGKKGKKEK